MSSLKTRHKRIVKHEWHALPVSAVLEAVGSRLSGLTPEEVEERSALYGSNEFTKPRKEPLHVRVFKQCRGPLVAVLIAAFFITIALSEYIDATVILLALLIAIGVGLFQEGKASRAFEMLARSQVHHAVVVRDGKRHELEARNLVPGDIVLITSGMQVPADIRIVDSKKLSVNEAPLTGEWLAVKKSQERIDVGTPFAEIASMLRLGTFVASGHGLGVVVATGDETAMGMIARDLGDIEDEITPIQWEMAKISKTMLIVIVGLVALIFLIGVFRGESLEFMLLTSIAIAVASIPEGLPAAVTIILAVGMEALLKRGGLVRNLLAAETLGSTTYILTDKTGTLTEGRMAITDMVYVGCDEGSDGRVCDWDNDEHAKNLLDIALCASDAFLDEHANAEDAYIVRGEPLERAVLEAAQEVGITLHGESLRAHRIDLLAFESENRFAAGLTIKNSNKRLCVNGSPELLLANAVSVITPEGIKKFSSERRKFFEETISIETQNGKRLIGVAYKPVQYEIIPDEIAGLIDDLVFVGLLIVTDPVRDDIREAIAGVLSAGAKIRLVTGDNPETALTIAREVGIARELDIALTGTDIQGLTNDELLEVVRTTRVFARVLPRQKMRLVEVLQASGEIVAMTGDGINDAPALRRANIGVAIGSGTEVAKESSDLVLVDDSFSTIYAAIEEGRRIMGNLRKIVGYLVSTSLSEVVLIIGALVSFGPIPILPTQILWANMIEEGLMSVAFAFEKGEANAMKEKPRDIHEEGVLNREMLFFIAMVVGLISILLLILYTYLRVAQVSIEEMRSVMFIAISIDSLCIAFSFRSLKTPLWNIPFKSNMFFIVSFFLNLFLLGLVITVPLFQTLLSYEPLSLSLLTLPILYGLATLVVVEFGKHVFFRRS